MSVMPEIPEGFVPRQVPWTLEKYVQMGFEVDEQERLEVTILGAKLRTWQHPRLSSGGPRIVAYTHPHFEDCAELALRALAGSPKIRQRKPRRWPPVTHYAGLVLRSPFLEEAPVTAEDIGVLGRTGPIPAEYWKIGFGWIQVVKDADEFHEPSTWFKDENRTLEIGLLRLLCQDPLARETLATCHRKNLQLPSTLTEELLGPDNQATRKTTV